MARIRIYPEATDKKAFACALDWPGWARAAKTEDLAIEALTSYADRYARIAAAAAARWPAAFDLEVVERLTGTTTTEFGALDKAPKGRFRQDHHTDGPPTCRLVASKLGNLRRDRGGCPCRPAEGAARRRP